MRISVGIRLQFSSVLLTLQVLKNGVSIQLGGKTYAFEPIYEQSDNENYYSDYESKAK